MPPPPSLPSPAVTGAPGGNSGRHGNRKQKATGAPVAREAVRKAPAHGHPRFREASTDEDVDDD